MLEVFVLCVMLLCTAISFVLYPRALLAIGLVLLLKPRPSDYSVLCFILLIGFLGVFLDQLALGVNDED